ncbi:MAG: DUF3465 domain-containing protein [Candidatus Baltobacteraceae bacterium]
MIGKRLLFGCAMGIVGCSQATPINGNPCQAYLNEASRVEVTATGQVARVLGLRNGPSGAHEGFIMKLPNCNNSLFTVKVEDNVSFAGNIPLTEGDTLIVKGEYEYYPRGGVIHWTHRDPRGRHAGGYIEFNGKRYQ